MKKFLSIVILLACLVSCTSKHAKDEERIFTKLAVTSSTHVGFLHALGADSLIVGMADKQYCYHDLPNVPDLGSSINLDVERILASGAEVIFLSSYSDDNAKAESMRKVGITPVFIDEWKEESPLARAAWIKTIAHLIGRDREADSIYASVEQTYLTLVSHPDSSHLFASHPDSSHLFASHLESLNLRNLDTLDFSSSIMSGSAWQGTWYVPGPNTYMARLFADAGFAYVFSDTTNTSAWGGQEGSIPLTFEQALLNFREADVWVGAPAATLDDLLAMNEHHAWFRSFQTERVYNFNKRVRETGANDFWETGVVHPELVLRDLILIRCEAPDSLLYFASHLQ